MHKQTNCTQQLRRFSKFVKFTTWSSGGLFITDIRWVASCVTHLNVVLYFYSRAFRNFIRISFDRDFFFSLIAGANGDIGQSNFYF